MAPTGNNHVEPHDNLYTVLVVASAAMLFIGTVFLIIRSYQLFGSIWPAGSAS